MASKKRRFGPEPMDPEERRSLLVAVKLSPNEMEQFKAAAGNTALSTWLRLCALEAVQRKKTLADADLMRKQAEAILDAAQDRLAAFEKDRAELGSYLETLRADPRLKEVRDKTKPK